MSSPIETTLIMLKQEIDVMARRAVSEDRAELIENVRDLLRLSDRLAHAFNQPPLVDSGEFLKNLKKRFLLSTTNKVVGGIFTDEAVSAPIDPASLRRNSRVHLGVGLEEHLPGKVAIDAPCYHPENPYFGLIVPGEGEEEWYAVRDKGDMSYVMLLEHEWISGYGSDMVMVKQVLGLGREALRMAEEFRPGLIEWIYSASSAFLARYEATRPERGIPGFYRFSTESFSRHPW